MGSNSYNLATKKKNNPQTQTGPNSTQKRGDHSKWGCVLLTTPQSLCRAQPVLLSCSAEDPGWLRWIFLLVEHSSVRRGLSHVASSLLSYINKYQPKNANCMPLWPQWLQPECFPCLPELSVESQCPAAMWGVLPELLTSSSPHSATDEACFKLNKNQMFRAGCIIAQLKRGYKVAR